jgi:hypothetical protein
MAAIITKTWLRNEIINDILVGIYQVQVGFVRCEDEIGPAQT